MTDASLERRLCTATKRDGTPCTRWATEDTLPGPSDKCLQHAKAEPEVCSLGVHGCVAAPKRLGRKPVKAKPEDAAEVAEALASFCLTPDFTVYFGHRVDVEHVEGRAYFDVTMADGRQVRVSVAH